LSRVVREEFVAESVKSCVASVAARERACYRGPGGKLTRWRG
jgi:hypothetical protein